MLYLDFHFAHLGGLVIFLEEDDEFVLLSDFFVELFDNVFEP
jgi:hypothetical protein